MASPKNRRHSTFIWIYVSLFGATFLVSPALKKIIFSKPDDSFHQDKTGKVYIDGIVNAEELFAQSSNWSDPTCSEQTRYGILSVMHKATKIKCRMIFGTGVPVRNTKVIQCLFDAQPLCKCTVNVIRELNEQKLR